MAYTPETKTVADFVADRKARVLTIPILSAVTIEASGSTTTDNIMSYLVGGKGYNTLQLAISGTGTLAVTLTGSVDGTKYGSVVDGYGSSLSSIATGLLAANDGQCISLNLPLLAGAKLTFTETGGANSVTVTATLCCKA